MKVFTELPNSLNGLMSFFQYFKGYLKDTQQNTMILVVWNHFDGVTFGSNVGFHKLGNTLRHAKLVLLVQISQYIMWWSGKV